MTNLEIKIPSSQVTIFVYPKKYINIVKVNFIVIICLKITIKIFFLMKILSRLLIGYWVIMNIKTVKSNYFCIILFIKLCIFYRWAPQVYLIQGRQISPKFWANILRPPCTALWETHEKKSLSPCIFFSFYEKSLV